MRQVDAVFKYVCELRGQSSFDEAVSLTKEEKERVTGWICDGIAAGEIDFSERAREKYDTPEKVRGYVIGMINNHLRKDKRLNGGVTYQPKHPGSRTGSQDPTLRELRKLLKVTPDEHKDLVQAEIDKRLEELREEKMKQVEINTELLPESLKDIVG